MLALLTLTGAPGIRAALPCFAETQQCLNDRFEQYWRQHGDLPVFGYPISAAADARNADTGQPVLSQWLERNRFELHPANAAP